MYGIVNSRDGLRRRNNNTAAKRLYKIATTKLTRYSQVDCRSRSIAAARHKWIHLCPSVDWACNHHLVERTTIITSTEVQQLSRPERQLKGIERDISRAIQGIKVAEGNGLTADQLGPFSENRRGSGWDQELETCACVIRTEISGPSGIQLWLNWMQSARFKWSPYRINDGI